MEDNYKQGLEQALTWIKTNYNPIGIIVSGSIIRGNPNANSDFDIFVIHSGNYKQRVQKFFNKVPCEIFINTLESMYEYFEAELKQNRPSAANMMATGKIYFGETNAELLKLIEEAKRYAGLSNGLTEEQIVANKYSIATSFEDANDILTTDKATASLLLSKTVSEIVFFVYALNKVPMPRIKERISELIRVHAAVGTLVLKYYSTENIAEKYELVAQMLDLLFISRNFFEWESDRIKST